MRVERKRGMGGGRERGGGGTEEGEGGREEGER